ncbi:MAG: hspA [Solirubrobacterales bacterium]|jgi:HSP20 family protein|nr:hspA [Solirubrobacterales bacterium]
MLWTDPFETLFAPLVPAAGRTAAFLPPADLTVSDGDLVLTMDLPGLRVEDVEIELVSGHLVVRGERRRPGAGEGTTHAHVERTFGRFERRVKVPDGVDPESITASMDDGVLSLIVPKPERMKPRTISISVGGNARRELESTT